MSSKYLDLKCDYLVVGAGTANLSFVDSLLTHHSTASVILIDRNSTPGGHWTTAYPFVRLHQPACWYGINSLELGTNRTASGDEIFDISDRSSSQEICAYYDKAVKNLVSTNRVRTFFKTEYSEELVDGVTKHIIFTPDGEYAVRCQKVVRCETKVIVPSMRELPFPVHPAVTAKPLNYIPKAIESGSFSKFLIIGAGKSGTDAIVQLLRSGIDQSQITWIISRDVWYAMRDGMWDAAGKKFFKKRGETLDILLKASSLKDCILGLEKAGQFARLDPNGPYPQVFKGPTIDRSELELARSIKNVVRLGRVRSILEDQVILADGMIPISARDTLVVDCMAENMYGYADFDMGFKVFNQDRIRIGPVTHTFNPSLTSALVGYLEATFYDDSIKNGFLYFPCGLEMTELRPESFILSAVAQLYTNKAIQHYTPAFKFVMKSRTNPEAPMHHGGMLNLIWAAVGPPRLKKKANLLLNKFKNGGFVDFNNIYETWPNATTLNSKTIMAALRTNESATMFKQAKRRDCISEATAPIPEDSVKE